MLKKTITYQDLDGNDFTEDFYFNMSKAELAEMELSSQGGFGEHLQRLISSNNGKEIIAAFKKILSDSYGVRSEDGKRFVKSEQLSREFLQTDAYSTLFMELVTDPDAGSNFINGLVPADLLEASRNQQQLPFDNSKMPANVQAPRTPMPTATEMLAQGAEVDPERQEPATETVEQLKARIAALEAGQG